MPRAMKPQLATQADDPPQAMTAMGARDQVRRLPHHRACVIGGKVQLLTRTGIDWTERYGVLADAFADLPVQGGDPRWRDRRASTRAASRISPICSRR